jgi:hypothetical protein
MDVMANLPRVEITDKALSVLKLETALSGVGQKQTLEALVLRAASVETLALVEKKAVILKAATLPEQENITPEKSLGPKVEIIPAVEDLPEQENIRSALVYIRDELTREHFVSLDHVVKTFGVKPGAITRRGISANWVGDRMPGGIPIAEARKRGYSGSMRYITDLDRVQSALDRLDKASTAKVG